MQKTLLTLFVCVLALFGGSTIAKADKAYVGYCENSLATASTGRISGISGTNAEISLAMCLTPTQFEAFMGCKVEGVRWGIPTNAETLPTFTKVWLRKEKFGENIATGTAMVQAGWNEISLDTPITLTDDIDSLWVGVTYGQGSKISVISFAGETHPLGAFVGKAGKLTDYSTKNWGSLSIEAVVSGEVPTHNIGFLTVGVTQPVVQIGKPITVTGSVKNNASETCMKPIINYTLNGKEKGSYTLNSNIPYRSYKTFSFEIPTTSITEECTAEIDLELVWSDGSVDEAPADNVAHISSEMVKEIMYRQMVVEEGTGAWCGWCVRGIVGMKEMREKYPERFIGIAIHNGDDYVVSAYDNWFSSQSSGFPSCLINRNSSIGVTDPGFSNLEKYYETIDLAAEAFIDVEADYNAETNVLTMASKTKFLADVQNADYRVAFVLTEDQLPIVQSNYYSGGGSGEMGGFENLGSKAKVNVDDVARGVWPSPTGSTSSLPSTISKGTYYTYSYETQMPKIANIENVAVIALVINGKTKEIVQGAKVHGIHGITGVNTVLSNETAEKVIYNLSGRRVNSDSAKGLVIENGKKVIK